MAISREAQAVCQFGSGVVHQVAANAHSLLAKLPHHAHFRAPLVSQLLHKVPAEVAAEFAAVSASAIYKARVQNSFDNVGELVAAYPANLDHVQIDPLLAACVQAWICEQCPTKSGSDSVRFTQWLTSEKLYETFALQFPAVLAELLTQTQALPVTSARPAALSSLLRELDGLESVVGFWAFVVLCPAAVRTFGGEPDNALGMIVVEYLHGSRVHLPTPLSRPVFDRIKKQLPIRRPRAHSGMFDCNVCATGKTAQADLRRFAKIGRPLSRSEQQKQRAAQPIAAKFELHLKVLAAQRAAFDKLKLLPAGHALVLADFSSYDLQPNVGESSRSKAPLSTLVLVINRANRRRLYVDVLVSDPNAQTPKDSLFVRAAFLAVFNPEQHIFEGISAVTLGTDTCAAQFRSRFVLPQFAGIAHRFGLRLQLLFHAAHHGHSLADAHVAKARGAIRQYLLEQEGIREREPDQAGTLLSPLNTAEDLRAVLVNHFTMAGRDADYMCVILPTIPRDPPLKPNARKLPGIMKIHQIDIESPTQIQTRELSSDVDSDLRRLRFAEPWTFDTGERACCSSSSLVCLQEPSQCAVRASPNLMPSCPERANLTTQVSCLRFLRCLMSFLRGASGALCCAHWKAATRS